MLWTLVSSSFLGGQTDSAESAYARQLALADAATPEKFNAIFERAVMNRVAREGLEDTLARVAIREDLADLAIARRDFSQAISHLGHALSLAEHLADADLIITFGLRRAQLDAENGAVDRANATARTVWEMTRQLGRTDQQVEAGLLLAHLISKTGFPDRLLHLYHEILALEVRDRLAVLIHRAEHSDVFSEAIRTVHWSEVLARASERDQPSVQARALDKLAALAAAREDFPAALAQFEAADVVAPDYPRTAVLWNTYASTIAAVSRPGQARAVVTRALANIDENQEPDIAANLHDTLATMQSQAGDDTAAYQSLRYASELRTRPRHAIPPMRVRMTGPTPTATEQEAVELAAVRNALRDAELASTRMQHRYAIALLMALLGLGFLYKRHTSVKLTLVRDAAELRAENLNLIALRHQLTPHFLFNALNNLRSRVFSHRDDAAELIDRLTAFCRQALQVKPGGIATVADESSMLTAFLDIEQARWEDNLQLKLEFDPHARNRLIPTLLLLPLVENALKYGTQTSEERIALTLRLRLSSRDSVEIEITNSGHWIEPGTAPRHTSNGVGLANIRQRLERLYPDRHHFEVGPSSAGVTARLELIGEPTSA